MKIDLKFLRELKSNIESQEIIKGKNYVESGSKLDYRVKKKMRSNNLEELKRDFEVLLNTQKSLMETLDLSTLVFSNLDNLQNYIKILEFIPSIDSTQTFNLESLYTLQIESLEGLYFLIENFKKRYDEAINYNTLYEIEIDQDSYDTFITLFDNIYVYPIKYEDDVLKIPGSVLLPFVENLIIQKTNLEEYKKTLEETITSDDFNPIYFPYFINSFPENYRNKVSRDDKTGYVIVDTLIDDIGIENDIKTMELLINKFNEITIPIIALKTQRHLLESMIYDIKVAEKLKEFEDVVNNDDFKENSIAFEIHRDKNEIYTEICLIREEDINIYNKLPDYIKEQYPLKEGNYIDSTLTNILYFDTEKNPLATLDYNINNLFDITSNLKYLTEEQQGVLFYQYRINGTTSALNYIEALKDQINNQKGFEEAYNDLKKISKDGLDFFDNTNLFGKGFFEGGIGRTFDGIGNLIYSDGIRSVKDYKQMYLLQILEGSTYTMENYNKIAKDESITIEEKTKFLELVNLSKELGEGFWRWLSQHSYQIGSSTGYMALPIALNLAVPGTGSALLFASTMGNAVEQSHQKTGKLGWETYTYGATTALSEIVTEKLGGLPGFGKFSQGFLKSVLAEGTQEFFQTFLNGAIDAKHYGMVATEFDLRRLTPEAIQSAIYGIVTAGIIQGATIPIKLLTIEDGSKVEYVFKNFEEALGFLEILGIEQEVDVMAIKRDSDTITFYHGGAESDFNIEKIDVLRSSEKQGGNYAGFYMVGEQDLGAAIGYARQENQIKKTDTKGVVAITMPNDIKIYHLQEGSFAITRIKPELITELQKQGYDVIAGKVLGKTEYVLLNKDKIIKMQFQPLELQ